MNTSGIVVILLAALVPLAASAGTKRIDCMQTTDTGVDQKVVAMVDDASDKAEVSSYALTADCARSQTCVTDIYNKDVLPSVIRLTRVMNVGSLVSFNTVMDIDRASLAIVTRTKLSGSVRSETTAHGQCTVTANAAKNVL